MKLVERPRPNLCIRCQKCKALLAKRQGEGYLFKRGDFEGWLPDDSRILVKCYRQGCRLPAAIGSTEGRRMP